MRPGVVGDDRRLHFGRLAATRTSTSRAAGLAVGKPCWRASAGSVCDGPADHGQAIPAVQYPEGNLSPWEVRWQVTTARLIECWGSEAEPAVSFNAVRRRSASSSVSLPSSSVHSAKSCCICAHARLARRRVAFPCLVQAGRYARRLASLRANGASRTTTPFFTCPMYDAGDDEFSDGFIVKLYQIFPCKRTSFARTWKTVIRRKRPGHYFSVFSIVISGFLGSAGSWGHS